MVICPALLIIRWVSTFFSSRKTSSILIPRIAPDAPVIPMMIFFMKMLYNIMEPKIKIFNAPNPDGNGAHEISYAQWGEGDHVVFCVHGLTRNGRDFDWLARELAQNGMKVIAPDMRGRGRSAWANNHEHYDNAVYIADCFGIIEEHAPSKLDWVGTSMGGIMGMAISATRPNFINKLVLNDIGAVISEDGMRRIKSYVKDEVRFENLEVAQARFREIFAPFKIEGEENWQHMFEHGLMKSEAGHWSFNYDPNVGKMFPEPFEVDMWRIWEAIKSPILVLRGSESDIFERDVALKMAEDDHVEFVEFEGYGHVPPLMNDEQIGVVREFLVV